MNTTKEEEQQLSSIIVYLIKNVIFQKNNKKLDLINNCYAIVFDSNVWKIFNNYVVYLGELYCVCKSDFEIKKIDNVLIKLKYDENNDKAESFFFISNLLSVCKDYTISSSMLDKNFYIIEIIDYTGVIWIENRL